MKALEHIARSASVGFAPDGKSYSHVADFIDAVGYGGIKKGGRDTLRIESCLILKSQN